MSLNVQISTGIITDNGGDTPRPQNQIVYSVSVNMPGGVTVDFAGIRPKGKRWPADVDVEPASKGTPFFVSISANRTVVCHFDEWIAYAECPAPAGGNSFVPPGGGGGQDGTTPGGGGPGGPIGGIGGGTPPGGVF